MNEWIEINIPWNDDSLSQPILKNYPDLSEREREVFGESFEEVKKRTIRKLPANWNDESLEDQLLYKEFREFKVKIEEWYDLQPEIIEVESFNKEALKRFKEIEKAKSFSRSEWAKPGVVIEVLRSDGTISQMMIGDINTNGGVCNDCAGISSSDIIKRYKIVWSKED